MIATKLARAILIVVLCLAIALAGVTGVHAHLANGNASAHSHVSSDTDGERTSARLIAFIDSEHLRAHEINGEIDIEPATKAFGKFLQISIFLALTFAVLIGRSFAHEAAAISRCCSVPRRPPRNRLRLGLLPPSNAPPQPAL